MRILVAIAATPLLFVAAVSSHSSMATPVAVAGVATSGTAIQSKPDESAKRGFGPPRDEFVGPFASWVNVRTQHQARGDGVADDTSALQAALDGFGPEGRSPVVFIPAGTYRITRSLSLNYNLGVTVIGEDPEQTRIVWDGAVGGAMLVVRGVAYSRISRLTFDGRGKASIGVDQTWDNQHGNFDTGNEYTDDRFVDLEYGIRGGFEGHGFAETSILRARFVRNSVAGVALGNFNALDIWVWHSLFEDCGAGVSNSQGAGNFRVYNSVFRRSKIADLLMQNTGGFTAHDNYSVGSKAFWLSGSAINHPATIDIQGNTIVDPLSPVAIRLANQGPGSIMDNRIRSLPNTSGPVISWSSLFGSDVLSLGNSFTVSNAVSANGRLFTLDDRLVSREAIAVNEPLLPAAQPDFNRRVFDVAPGASAATIQRTIDMAVREGGVRPVVPLPFGRYAIDRTLSIPVSDVQIVGDGMLTILRWSGPGRGPMVALASPTRATLRELQLDAAGTADGIVAAGIDQAGSRAYLEGVQLRGGLESNLLVDRAAQASVQLVDFGHANSPRGTSIRIVGGAAAPRNGGGQTVIYSGASSGNRLSYEVSSGGTLIARDIWYEGPAEGGFARVRDQGRFTLQGARVATPEGWATPAFTVDADAGRLTLLTTLFDDRLVVTGSAGRAGILGLANLRENSTRPAFTNSSPPVPALIMSLRQRSKSGGLIPRGTVPVPDIGSADPAFMRTMLQDARSAPAPSLDAAPAGATDLRLFRVWIVGGAVNIVLAGPRLD